MKTEKKHLRCKKKMYTFDRMVSYIIRVNIPTYDIWLWNISLYLFEKWHVVGISCMGTVFALHLNSNDGSTFLKLTI